MSPEIINASEIKRSPRKSPADQLLDDLEGDFSKLTDVAREVGVHPETLRRLCRTDKVNAPSHAVQQGGMTMYLFTPEDVDELKSYFARGRMAFKLFKDSDRV
jgi:hypothetical protein